MREDNSKVLGWGTIIAIMIGVGLAVGLVLGLLSRTFGFSLGATTAGVGACVGVVGALLVTRRRAALEQQEND